MGTAFWYPIAFWVRTAGIGAVKLNSEWLGVMPMKDSPFELRMCGVDQLGAGPVWEEIGVEFGNSN